MSEFIVKPGESTTEGVRFNTVDVDVNNAEINVGDKEKDLAVANPQVADPQTIVLPQPGNGFVPDSGVAVDARS